MIEIKNINQYLEKQAKHDPVTRVAIGCLLDNSNGSFFVTEIAAGKSVSPRDHLHNAEIYFIVSGSGVIYTAKAKGAPPHTQKVQSGDFFRIPANTTHQLENTGDAPLVLLFASHPDHLDTDRYAQKINVHHFKIAP